MLDVLIVGAGPAGAVAATVLARTGARVRLVDRARFPREKLCGDTVNPGTLALLRRLDLAEQLDTRGLPIHGMVVTGEDGVAVESPYPDGLQGRSLVRSELDWALLQQAMAAGAEFEPWTIVRRAVAGDEGQNGGVSGVIVDTHTSERTVRARVVIAADGRHSTLAFGLGLARHPDRPRRWAIGAYFESVSGVSSFGEMHIRRGGYIGVAPIPGGLVNVCLVKPWEAPGRPMAARGLSDRGMGVPGLSERGMGPSGFSDRGIAPPGFNDRGIEAPGFGNRGIGAPGFNDVTFRDPQTLLRRELARDPVLRERFAGARLVTPPVVLGPLAVDVKRHAIHGLLLAGDAAGFIDPMTGDGLRFAVTGGELAARAALRALEHGWAGVHAQLERERRREFAAKWRFNRTLRTLVSLPAAVRIGGGVASVVPSALRAVVRRAGDCPLAL